MINEHLLGLGIKSPVQLSPGQEHDMNVIIATRHAKEIELKDDSTQRVTNLPDLLTKDKNNVKLTNFLNDKENGGVTKIAAKNGLLEEDWRKKFRPASDIEYDILMNEVLRIKNNLQQDVEIFKFKKIFYYLEINF